MTKEDLQYLQEMENRILEQSSANMRVILESSIGPQFNLLFEKLGAMEEKITPTETIDEHEDRLEALESTVRVHSREIAKLKKAQ